MLITFCKILYFENFGMSHLLAASRFFLTIDCFLAFLGVISDALDELFYVAFVPNASIPLCSDPSFSLCTKHSVKV